ncbi:hypothetical protein evm_002059 [Chilo suppressalis]|nr:hypothetical protein evm_002059 [Chilo suppressalis]
MKFQEGSFVDIVPEVDNDDKFVFGDPQNLCEFVLPVPAYSPILPASPSAPAYNPMSLASPSAPAYSPMSPASPRAPAYSPISPASPRAPAYSPISPASPRAPAYSPISPASPRATAYSPISPASQGDCPPAPPLGSTPRRHSRGTFIIITKIRRVNFDLPEESD